MLVALSLPFVVEPYVWAVEVLAILFAVTCVRCLDCRTRLPMTRGRLATARLPRTAYVVLWAYVLVMLVGATWTYAGAPPGAWLQAAFDLARNPWDRIGHLFQGALPALVALSLRRTDAAPTARLSAGVALALGTAAGVAIGLTFEGLEGLAQLWAPAGVDFVQAQGDALDRWWDLALAGLGGFGAAGGAVLLMRREGAPSADLRIARDRR